MVTVFAHAAKAPVQSLPVWKGSGHAEGAKCVVGNGFPSVVTLQESLVALLPFFSVPPSPLTTVSRAPGNVMTNYFRKPE